MFSPWTSSHWYVRRALGKHQLTLEPTDCLQKQRKMFCYVEAIGGGNSLVSRSSHQVTVIGAWNSLLCAYRFVSKISKADMNIFCTHSLLDKNFMQMLSFSPNFRLQARLCCILPCLQDSRHFIGFFVLFSGGGRRTTVTPVCLQRNAPTCSSRISCAVLQDMSVCRNRRASPVSCSQEQSREMLFVAKILVFVTLCLTLRYLVLRQHVSNPFDEWRHR